MLITWNEEDGILLVNIKFISFSFHFEHSLSKIKVNIYKTDLKFLWGYAGTFAQTGVGKNNGMTKTKW